MIGRITLTRPLLVALAALLAACGGDDPTVGATPSPSVTSTPPAGGLPTGVLAIDTGDGDVEIRVEIAETAETRQIGLMNRESLPEDAGMVFLHDAPTQGGFWMKNTLIPLSVAAWDESGRIGDIVDMEPCEAEPCEVYPLDVAWVGAVEVNQGFFEDRGIEVGDMVTLRR